jgi:uncharacterized integral membrane protein
VNDLPSKKTLESTGENYGFRMNGRQIGGALVAIVLVVFILSNREPVTVDFLFISWNTSQWVVLTVTAVAGAIAGAGVFARRQRRKARRASR